MRVAVFGATGLVGRAMLKLLEKRTWVDGAPVVLASSHSVGSRLEFRGGDLVCSAVSDEVFAGIDLALFSAGAERSLRYAPIAIGGGCRVIDNSSAYRMDPDVPLVVPEINGDLIPVAGSGGGIIANPNCSTIQIAMALAPLHARYGLHEVHVTTLQSVSGAGADARRALADELRSACGQIDRGEEPVVQQSGIGAFPRTIAFNVIPEIGPGREDGSYEEEDKVVRELRKILDLPGLPVTCLATRVPVWNGHAASVRAVFGEAVASREAAALLGEFPGVSASPGPLSYLTPAEASGSEGVHVGRLRRDPDRPEALSMWVVADNLLKGAALNAVQIADRIAAAAGDGNGS